MKPTTHSFFFQLVLLVGWLIAPHAVSAATYYVCGSGATCNAQSSGWVTGNDANNCTAKATPCATSNGVEDKLSSGDTAIFGDGSYTTPSCFLAYGSPTNGYTTIKAEHMGGVQMGGVSCQNASQAGDAAYWVFDGLVFDGPSLIAGLSHVKFLRDGSSDGGEGNSGNFMAGEGASYILFENCYAWGQGRYKFLAWHADNIVMRGNVARMDAEPFSDNQQLAGLVMYTMNHGLMANNIVIDSDHPELWPDGSPIGCVYIPDTSGSTLDITLDTNVCLNSKMGGIGSDGYEGGGDYFTTVNAHNNVVWNAVGETGNLGTNVSRGHNSIWWGNTFGVGPSGPLSYLSLYASDGVTIHNNLFYSIQAPLAHAWANGAHDYNAFYTISSGLPTLSAHERTNINPIWNASTNPTGALKYITRIEPGSNLVGIGQNGENIGATLQYMIGTPGTLWGEAGYDVVQSTPMWPFPNEAVIKAKMATYTYPGLSGARGFAAPGTGLYGGPVTLTSYIWEYLGNACPPEICAPGADTTPPAAPSGLGVQ